MVSSFLLKLIYYEALHPERIVASNLQGTSKILGEIINVCHLSLTLNGPLQDFLS